MGDMLYGLPRDNLKKMRKASRMSDAELRYHYGIGDRFVMNARLYIEKRISEMTKQKIPDTSEK